MARIYFRIKYSSKNILIIVCAKSYPLYIVYHDDNDDDRSSIHTYINIPILNTVQKLYLKDRYRVGR